MDSLIVDSDVQTTIDVLASASDLDGDAITLDSVGATTNANSNVAIVNGEIVYTPESGFTGTDSFEYTISDDKGGVVTQVLNITVEQMDNDNTNNELSLSLDSAIVDENSEGTVIGNIILNNAVNGENYSFAVDDSRFEIVNNQLKLIDGESLDYESESNVALVISVNSSTGLSNHNVSVNVNNINESPDVALPISDQVVSIDDIFELSVANVFNDVDGDSLTITATLSNGDVLPPWLTFDASTNTLSGTPSSGDTGIIDVKLTASDGNLVVNDVFSLEVQREFNVIEGTDAAETIYGTSLDDAIYGYAGNDKLRGYEGNNVLYGGDGSDTLRAAGGDDIMYGGNDNDYIFGFVGNDILIGEQGNDSLYGGDGNDTLYGGIGDDSLYAGAGADVIYGGDGDDYVYASDDNDIIYGGTGVDWLYGDSGDDIVEGQVGNDILYGGIGNDTISGGYGTDHMQGDAGIDTFVFSSISDSNITYGIDTIHNFEDGIDFIDLSALSSSGISSFVDLTVTGDGSTTTITGNSNNFELKLNGVYTLDATDFVF